MSNEVKGRRPHTKAEAGRIGARKRWGARRHVRLDALPEPVRRAIEAMVDAEAAAQQREREAATT